MIILTMSVDMKILLILNLIFAMIKTCGGVKRLSIEDFPHTAFLKMKCKNSFYGSEARTCCASILTQDILLTAAHCVHDCGEGSVISAFVGDSNINKGTEIPVVKVLVHEYFDPKTFIGDVAMLKLNTSVAFGINVKKVLISKDPPYYEKAVVSGWGATKVPLPSIADGSARLRAVTQNVWINRKCMKTMPNLPQGCRCSDYFDGVSGSPLVVRGYIQIGILSLKARTPSANVTVYTDVGYYFPWIEANIPVVHCSDEIPYRNLIV